MKKTTAMRLFFSFLIFVLTFQTSIAQKFFLGPRMGANLSQIRGLDYSLPRSGWNLGVFAGYRPCPHTGLTADILLSSNGSRSRLKCETGTITESWDAYINMNYLSIPLLYNIYFGKDAGSFGLKMFTGFSTAFLLSAKQNLKYSKEENATYVDLNTEHNMTGQFKRMDLGLIAGGGLIYKMQDNVTLNADVRYQYGLTDIRTQNSSYTNRLHNNNISLLLGMAYSFGK
jgi:hypothetical protein